MVNEWKMDPFFQPNTPSFKSKFAVQIGKTVHENERARKKSKQLATTAVAPTTGHPQQLPRAGRGGLWPGGSGVFRTLHFCALPWTTGLTLDHSYWAFFARFLDLIWPQLLYFLLKFGSTR